LRRRRSVTEAKTGSSFAIAPKAERRAAAENSRCYDDKVELDCNSKKIPLLFLNGIRCRPNRIWFRGTAMLPNCAALFRSSKYDLPFVSLVVTRCEVSSVVCPRPASDRYAVLVTALRRELSPGPIP
jgi:hypothetical protein